MLYKEISNIDQELGVKMTNNGKNIPGICREQQAAVSLFFLIPFYFFPFFFFFKNHFNHCLMLIDWIIKLMHPF